MHYRNPDEHSRPTTGARTPCTTRGAAKHLEAQHLSRWQVPKNRWGDTHVGATPPNKATWRTRDVSMHTWTLRWLPDKTCPAHASPPSMNMTPAAVLKVARGRLKSPHETLGQMASPVIRPLKNNPAAASSIWVRTNACQLCQPTSHLIQPNSQSHHSTAAFDGTNTAPLAQHIRKD